MNVPCCTAGSNPALPVPYFMKKIFLSIRASFLFSASLLVVGTVNPIHSLLSLISVIFIGSVLLFSLSLEYFGLLFLIVYVGAIVVLFLFVVIMLEIKRVNTSTSFQELFSARSFIIPFILFLILTSVADEYLTALPARDIGGKTYSLGTQEFQQSNLYVNYSMLIHMSDQLRGLGALLFTEYKLTLIITGILLFLAIVGAIVLSLDISRISAIKTQDANNQAIRNPSIAFQGFGYLVKP